MSPATSTIGAACSAANRPIVARVVKQVYDTFRPRDWNQMATQFETVCVSATARDREPAHV